ncbi:alpha-tocopherol transfer protein-like protein [Dinothrombium tinctorium]|uniref:Alpha-tocopherol transfer protein-like protein n=1 Tax=Dinothrombium tinctorium TaxID=1965070 RepID=A0A3S3PE77_9ACAR|nr:alpha-tocopherol transfer protein-like protein [Dinothrombium tinctorium]RWS10568.1 alpha-tocopherol transfer protein-like protein [Dinothrombium tinctorium]RWS11835.1 alpha-tocopherol transfer protein-like protein [Dinothrombium tinctorium]
MEVEMLKEKEKCREKYMRELSAKLKHEGVKIQLEEEFLVKFLRSRLYNVDQTCGAIKTYLANFKKYPKFFTGVDVIKDAVESGFFEILPERNVTGETISIMRPAKWNPSKMSFNQCIASTVYAFELDKMDEEAQINGTIEIIDMKDAGFRQFSKLEYLHDVVEIIKEFITQSTSICTSPSFHHLNFDDWNEKIKMNYNLLV